MGSIKRKLQEQEEGEPDVFHLTEEEFGYLVGLNFSRNNIINEFARVMSGFLYYVSTFRLGYDGKTDLKFEVDFDNDKRELKVWKLGENLYNDSTE